MMIEENDLFDTPPTTANIKELVNQLVEKAKTGKHSSLEGIRNYPTLQVALEYKKALKKVIKMFKVTKKNLCKTYIEYIKGDIDYLQVLFEYNTSAICLDFYKDELDILDAIIGEYCDYLILPWNMLKSYWWGYERDDTEIREISLWLKQRR